MTASLRVSIVRDEKEFDSLREPWNALLGQSSSETVFLTWEWLFSWWNSYGSGKRLWILKIEKNGELIGLAPLYRQQFRKLGLAYRGLYWVGDGSADSDYLDLIAQRGEEDLVVRTFVRFLGENRREWDLLFANEVPESSATLPLLKKYLGAEGCYWQQTENRCSYTVLPENWDGYLQSLKPRVRTKIRSLTANLERRFQVRFDRCDEPGELGARLDSLFQLHNRRWQENNRDGVFLSPAKRGFYEQMSGRFQKNGWLRFYSLALNGQYAAHQFCFEYRNTMFLLQEGFDPGFAANGIGNVLRAYVMRDCIDRRVGVYDFLGGVTQHKLSWGAKVKSSIRACSARPTVKNRMFLDLPRAAEAGKQCLKAVLPEAVVDWGKGLVRKAPIGKASPKGLSNEG
jgi:CelD/BcsL family acetyltransferase involved in cellulose biosynthesis